jgi:DnaK suppressor protein
MAGIARRGGKLRRVLNTRRDTARHEVLIRLRDRRTGGSRSEGDDMDVSDAHAQSDLDLALLEMTSDTLARIDAALGRMDRGAYGVCVECDQGIAERRLRALPFATRCRDCEDQREQRTARLDDRRDGVVVLPNRPGS